MGMRTNRQLIRKFVWWHNVEVFVLPRCDWTPVYVPVPDWWVGREPSRFLLEPSPSVLSCFSGVMLCGSEADKAHVCWFLITQFLVFVLVPLVAATCDGVFTSKTADPRIVEDDFGVTVPMPDRLAGWIPDLGFFPIVCKTVLDPVLAYVSFSRGKRSTCPAFTSKTSSFTIAGVRERRFD